MNADALEALKDSIAHWGRLSTGTRQPDEVVGPSDCALCRRFNHPTPPTLCVGCPVAGRTKLAHCSGTPYAQAAFAFGYYGPDSPEFKAAAKKELEFLQSLLPSSHD